MTMPVVSHSRFVSADAVCVSLLGVRFDSVTNAETLDLIDRMIASRQAHLLVTANLNFLAQAQSDVELRRILLESDLVLCDGTPLLWISRWLGNRLPERVAGSDLVPQLARRAEEKGYRMFFLGSTPEIVAQCVANVRARHPGIRDIGFYAPSFAPLPQMDHEDMLRRVKSFAPDLLFVAMGCPKQEKWISMHLSSLGVPVSVGIGATVDFLACHVARAPLWMRRAGLEWLFRILQEPRRLFRRYIKDFFIVIWPVIRHLLSFRPGGPPGVAEYSEISSPAGSGSMLKVSGNLNLATVLGSRSLWRMVATGTGGCLMDLSEVRRLDVAGVGLICDLWRKLHRQGRELTLLRPSPAVCRALGLMRLTRMIRTATPEARRDREGTP